MDNKTSEIQNDKENQISPVICFKYNTRTKLLTRVDGKNGVSSKTNEMNLKTLSKVSNCETYSTISRKVKKVQITSAKQVSFSKKIEQIPENVINSQLNLRIETPTKSSISVTKFKSCREHVKTPFKSGSAKEMKDDNSSFKNNNEKINAKSNKQCECSSK